MPVVTTMCRESGLIMSPLSAQSAYKLPNLNLTQIQFRIRGGKSNITQSQQYLK